MNNESKNLAPMAECSEDHAHHAPERIGKMPSQKTLYEIADFFKIFGDSTRVNILFACDGDPICVCDIAQMLGMTKSAVSHQLKILRQSNLVTYHKMGKHVFYTLADDHVKDIIEKALEHINE